MSETVVVGLEQPDLTREAFRAILERAGSPAAAEAEASWEAVVSRRVSPAFALAIFEHESGFGRLGICARYGTKSPGNTRTSRTGVGEVIQTERGAFVRYPRWADGFADLAQRLVDPGFVYAQRGLVTVEQILPVWAPPSDGNNPDAYIAAVLRSMESWRGEQRRMRVALAAGHHNRDGGNATEHGITGELTEAYARAFRAAGADVRVITPDGPDEDSDPGDGDHSGGLQQVAQQVVTWAREGWTADLFLEVHTEGVGDPNVRGVFAIYPDWGGDVDVDVRDRLGPAVARAIGLATGLPVRGTGVMSERQTGVGASGSRLGIFLVTEPLKATTTRLIIEHGSHSSPADLAIIRGPGFNDAAAQAAAGVFLAGSGTAEPVPAPGGDEVIVVGPLERRLGHGFRRLYAELGAAGQQLDLRLLGWPVTDELTIQFSDNPGQDWTVQLFERGGLQWEGGNGAPWDNHALPVPYLIELYIHAIEQGVIADSRTPLLRERLKIGG